ncbi:hypothetical protein DAEQUDRAFT_330209 [Daedalea quercina L-15889]|uniref:Uncharacterized protein n=1 Tax=Daedalea quercina L-15889 TaxID=1314783 RepID=A0A165PQV8_9APHY|nr:hypothetical protein DAEQUDRAFT_330209 [Daedalea quercina L-15889]
MLGAKADNRRYPSRDGTESPTITADRKHRYEPGTSLTNCERTHASPSSVSTHGGAPTTCPDHYSHPQKPSILHARAAISMRVVSRQRGPLRR